MTVQYTKPDPVAPVGDWRPDFTEADWRRWIFGAKADQLRALCDWGLTVLASAEPVGWPLRQRAALPRELTPAARERLAVIRARRDALSRNAKDQESARRGAEARTQVRIPAGAYVPNGTELAARRRQLGLSQRAAAALSQLTRGALCDAEAGRREPTRARLWLAYEQYAETRA
jgi:DNA-binding transcriptional regulator YiaG